MRFARRQDGDAFIAGVPPVERRDTRDTETPFEHHPDLPAKFFDQRRLRCPLTLGTIPGRNRGLDPIGRDSDIGSACTHFVPTVSRLLPTIGDALTTTFQHQNAKLCAAGSRVPDVPAFGARGGP